MTDRFQRLCDEIRALEPAEQAHVLDLLGDQGSMPEPDVERVWLHEAERRARAMAAEAEAEEDVDMTASRDAINDKLKRR